MLVLTSHQTSNDTDICIHLLSTFIALTSCLFLHFSVAVRPGFLCVTFSAMNDFVFDRFYGVANKNVLMHYRIGRCRRLIMHRVDEKAAWTAAAGRALAASAEALENFGQTTRLLLTEFIIARRGRWMKTWSEISSPSRRSAVPEENKQMRLTTHWFIIINEVPMAYSSSRAPVFFFNLFLLIQRFSPD